MRNLQTFRKPGSSTLQPMGLISDTRCGLVREPHREMTAELKRNTNTVPVKKGCPVIKTGQPEWYVRLFF
ncbi:MAG: hypothetical protein ACLFST_10455 [Spirochaetia bacterium]